MNLIIWKYETIANLYSRFFCHLLFSRIMLAVFLDDIIDSTRILDRIRSIFHDHVRCLTRSPYMDITEFKNSLKYSWSMSVHFLYAVERALSDISRESRKLLYTDDTRVGDDDNIEFIIDPIDQDKCQKHDPIYRKSSPVEWSTDNIHDRYPIAYKYPSTYE